MCIYRKTYDQTPEKSIEGISGEDYFDLTRLEFPKKGTVE